MRPLVLLLWLLHRPASSLVPQLKLPFRRTSRRPTMFMSTVEPLAELDRLEEPPYFADIASTSDESVEKAALMRHELWSYDSTMDGGDSSAASSSSLLSSSASSSSSSLLQTILNKIGHIDESRLTSSHEYRSGIEPKLFSNLEYSIVASTSNQTALIARPHSQSVLASSALLCGTALGNGLVFLPEAIDPAGYGPTVVATLVAWGYMTVSALLTAELLINRCGETGKVRNVGLLELYGSYLGRRGGDLAALGFVVVSYVIMGVYFGQGGHFIEQLSSLSTTITSSSTTAATTTTTKAFANTIFASIISLFLATASKFGAVQRVMTHLLVPSTLLAFAATIAMAYPTADFQALFDPSRQHPELVLNAFPLLFMSWSSHAVVPRVVYDLEGDEGKIKKAIWGGSSMALIMYLVWNAVVLGNALHFGDATSTIHSDPVSLLHNTNLQTPIALVSELAVTTSLIGIILGFVNEFYDAIGTLPSPSYGPKIDDKWQVALLTLTPSVLFSILLGYYAPDLDPQHVMEYTGAFGASTLFLILPALMVWQNRYGEDARPLTVKPMFPLGKITLGSLYKAAGTLIVEQGLEKLGVFEFVSEHLLNRGGDL
jgi:amino acid permease